MANSGSSFQEAPKNVQRNTDSRFGYLIDKIQAADFTQEPFKHLYLDDFFSPADFAEITAQPEIAVAEASDDLDLFDTLFSSGYRIIPFPGCITNKSTYLKWHNGRGGSDHHSACEGFGMTLRLTDPQSDLLRELSDFLGSEAFNTAIADKFGVDMTGCSIDGGIQKYLDGYEISPHPDIRRKALTFMVNINPHEGSESLDHHTHYLKLRPEYSYVQTCWEGNSDIERCWVPWDWCDTQKQQTRNNSIVIFSPSNRSLHAVRAKYDHLKGQRTQLYGNIWYESFGDLYEVEWEDFHYKGANARKKHVPARRTVKQAVRDSLPEPVVTVAKKILKREQPKLGKRNF